MGPDTRAAELFTFLEEAKRLIRCGHYDFVPRAKNRDSLARCGLTYKDAKEELLDLTADDYHKGPKQDFDRPGTVWEFKKRVGDRMFYIKLKSVQVDGQDILRCLSFHEDDVA